jgi:16S rRNA processing protein RimM
MRAHGIKGEVRVKLLTDYPERISRGRFLYREERCLDPDRLTVEWIKHQPNDIAIIKFFEISDKSSAESLSDHYLFVRVNELGGLTDNSFWVHQLIGATVMIKDDGAVGIVAEVMRGKSSDFLIVQSSDGKKHMIPFVRSYVISIDIDKKVIEMNLPEGLI